jgi:hypothetical protein
VLRDFRERLETGSLDARLHLGDGIDLAKYGSSSFITRCTITSVSDGSAGSGGSRGPPVIAQIRALNRRLNLSLHKEHFGVRKLSVIHATGRLVSLLMQNAGLPHVGGHHSPGGRHGAYHHRHLHPVPVPGGPSHPAAARPSTRARTAAPSSRRWPDGARSWRNRTSSLELERQDPAGD